MNRKEFYDKVRGSLFNGKLIQPQVMGLERLLDEIEARNVLLNQGAYLLATAYHETGASIEPEVENLNYSAQGIVDTWRVFKTVEEARPYARNPEKLANRIYGVRDDLGNRGENSGDGWRYRGRGYVQVTGRYNYIRFTSITGVDLINNPEMACNQEIAAKILFVGSLDGLFTGKRLSEYITRDSCDFYHARRVINRLDKAEKIASYAERFSTALKAAA